MDKSNIEVNCNICKAPCCKAPIPLRNYSEFLKAANYLVSMGKRKDYYKYFIVFLGKNQENKPKNEKLYHVYLLDRKTKQCPFLDDKHNCTVYSNNFNFCKTYLCEAYGHKVKHLSTKNFTKPLVPLAPEEPFLTKSAVKTAGLRIVLRDNIL